MLNVCRDSRVVRLGTIACTYCLVHERLWICVVCNLRRKLTLQATQPCTGNSYSRRTGLQGLKYTIGYRYCQAVATCRASRGATPTCQKYCTLPVKPEGRRLWTVLRPQPHPPRHGHSPRPPPPKIGSKTSGHVIDHGKTTQIAEEGRARAWS